MTETDNFMQTLMAKSGNRLGLALTHDAGNPDQAAEHQKIAERLGLPSVVVQSDPDAFKRQVAQADMAKSLSGAPKTAAWLTDIRNGAIAKDDVANMSSLEAGIYSAGRAVERGVINLIAAPKVAGAMSSAAILGDVGKSLDDLTADELRQMGPGPYAPQQQALAFESALMRRDLAEGQDSASLLKEGADYLTAARDARSRASTLPRSEANQRITAALDATDGSLMGALRAMASDPGGTLAMVAETAAEFLPVIAVASLTTAVTRSPAAGLAVMAGGSFLSENSSSAMNFLAEKGVDLSTPESIIAAIQDEKLMGEAQARGLQRGVVVALFNAASGGIAGQALAKSPLGDVVAQGFAQMIFGSGGEAFAQMNAGQKFNWADVVIEGLAELATAPLEVGGVAGRAFLKSAPKAAKAGATQTALQGIDAVVAQSKLKTRAPDRFTEFVGTLEGKSLYVPADDLTTYFQAKDMSLDDGAAEFGLDLNDLMEKQASGGDVAIPMAVYAGKISGTDAAPWFHENATFDDTEMSVSEAARFNAEVRDILDEAYAESAAVQADELQRRASDQKFRDDVYSQLRAAGQTKDVAEQQAAVLTAHYRALAARTGKDVAEIVPDLLIQGPNADPARRRGNLDVAINTIRSGKMPKPVGVSLVDFIKDQGGIRDDTGDVGSMEPPKGVIAETSAQVRERLSQPSLMLPADGKGMSLDEMARKAVEAGYIADRAELLDAIGAELRGAKLYRPGEGVDSGLQSIADDIGRLGIDLSQSNDAIVASLESATFNQQARASITFSEGQTIIRLFENADLSSFLHEAGHLFLESFTDLASAPNAPQQMQDDLAAIRAYLKNDGSAVTVDQHETWARSVEAYLMEGKAPSLELADAFARFKSWLTRIYRTVAGLNVNLTPEIRGVMDRMLATDEEITAAREAQRMSPLFTDQKASGMSDASWAIYQRMARRSEEQAQQTLLEKTMESVRRQKEKWWRDEKADVQREVTAQVNSRREHRLIEMLANQRWIGSDREVPDTRIDRKALTEMFGDGVLAEMKGFGGKRAIYAEGGESPEVIADMFGFASASEMVETLQNTRKRGDVISAETDRIMADRYGDPLNDGTIEQEALLAIHSEQQAMTVAAEVRHIASRAGMPTRNLTARVFRQRAKLMLGRMTVREAIRADSFLKAERTAAKRAEDAFARVAAGRDANDALKAAAGHKEQQLLNHYLYLEARDFAKLVESKREAMRAYGKESVRKKLEGGYIEQIDGLLDQYDFRVRSKRQIARAESLRQFVDRMTAEGRAGELAIPDSLIDQSKKTHYTTMSATDLLGLFDTIANIDHLGRLKMSLVDAKKKRDLDATVAGFTGAMDANMGDNPPGRVEGRGERVKKQARDFLNLTLNADTLLREVDGFADLGPAWMAVKADVNAGIDRLTQRRFEMAKALDAIYNAYSAKEKRAMSVKRHNAALGDVFSKWDVISVALNTGNEANYARLTNPDTQGGFTPDQVSAALAELDARDWGVVQALWDYTDSFWPEIAEKERRNTGVSPKKVDARMMVDAPPGQRGGYYPIRYDARLATRISELDAKDIMDRMRTGSFGKAQTRNGHTKERVQSVNLPLKLDLGVLHQHLNSVLYDLEIGDPVNNAWRVLNDSRVVSMFRQKGRGSDHEALELWIQDVAAGDQVKAGFGTAALRHLRTGFVVSRLALNLSTALIQPSGIVQSAVVIGKRAMLNGTLSYLGRMGGWVSDVVSVSPFMKERQSTFERDIYNVVGDLESGPVTGRWAKFQRDVVIPLSFVMMQKVQFYAVDMPTWVGAYEKEIALSGDEAKARVYADAMVRRAQGSGLMSDRGMMERGTVGRDIRQSEIPRLFTALGSYMFAKGNVAYERTMRTNFKSPAQAMTWAVDMGLLFTFEAVLYAAVKGFLPGEDEDDAAWLAKQTALSAMSTLPFIRDVASVAQGMDGGIYASVLEASFARPMTQAQQGEADRALVKSLIDAGGIFFHLPAAQAKNVVNAFFENDMSLRNDPSIGTALGMGGEGRVTPMDYLFRQ